MLSSAARVAGCRSPLTAADASSASSRSALARSKSPGEARRKYTPPSSIPCSASGKKRCGTSRGRNAPPPMWNSATLLSVRIVSGWRPPSAARRPESTSS